MRWPLYLAFNLFLIALVGAGVAGVVQGNSRAEAGEREEIGKTLDGLIASWDAGGVPAEKRVINIFVGGAPGDPPLEAPEPRPFWAPLADWGRRDAAKSERARQIEALLGRERPLADWSSMGLTWASERQKRLQGLSRYMAKAHQAGAHLVIVAHDREARNVVAAVRTAGASSTDLVFADKLIVLGAGTDSYLALINQDDTEAKSPDRIREKLLIWHHAASGAAPEGVQIALRDSLGRVINRQLSGDAAKAEGAVRLVRGLTAPDADMETFLIRSGQIEAPPAPKAPAPAAPASAPTSTGGGADAARPASALPAAVVASLPPPIPPESFARAESTSTTVASSHPGYAHNCGDGMKRTYLPWELWLEERSEKLDRRYFDKYFPETRGLPAHCEYAVICGLLMHQHADESNYRYIVKPTTFLGYPAYITHSTDGSENGLKLDISGYLLNIEGNDSVFIALSVGSRADIAACPNDRLLPAFEQIARTLHGPKRDRSGQ